MHSIFRFGKISFEAFKLEIFRASFIPAHEIRENAYAANFYFDQVAMF